ncbi:MAG: XisH protein [Oscillatoriales cyanobacterium RU_3_3]|nr:XisH protein [Microcoleus sp. SU_5_6]NJM63388.1 XisH protein [Oscillatoriales cyanobacterium RU_3_3]NJR22936.1 XisH protein [Richelia sp. CSU_2_1]
MSAKDIYHAAVKSALIKDNWTISSNPYLIQCEDIDLAADIADARPIAAEREGQKIVVEIECFVGRALMLDFHQAVGRYKLYQMLLEKTAPEYELYLAIDDIIYENFFRRDGIDFLARSNQIKFFAVNIDEGAIVQWIS